jgi:hypothetical protein
MTIAQQYPTLAVTDLHARWWPMIIAVLGKC